LVGTDIFRKMSILLRISWYSAIVIDKEKREGRYSIGVVSLGPVPSVAQTAGTRWSLKKADRRVTR
jgi:hypothetical protein